MGYITTYFCDWCKRKTDSDKLDGSLLDPDNDCICEECRKREREAAEKVREDCLSYGKQEDGLRVRGV